MLKRQNQIALGILLLLVFVLLNLPGQTVAQLKLALSSLFLPLFRLEEATGQVVEAVGDQITPRRVLLQQLAEARHRNRVLEFQLNQYREAARQNLIFRRLLDYPPRKSWNLKAAPVVGVDPKYWWRTLHIGIGREEGVRPDCVVLTPNGLVGKVQEVYVGHSLVVLLGDPKCQVSAMVRETGESGILQPASNVWMDPLLVDLLYLPNMPRFSPGQWVVTSGKGGVFPKGIPIGKIVGSESVDYGLYSKATVRLAVNFNRLEQVWVIMP